MADQLSPANQVMIAVAYVYQEHGGEPPARAVAAAALRAAAEQCQIERNYHPDYPETEWVVVASDLTGLADELENND
jgi:hypothetical protein